jgi:hypothetical protein
MNVDRILGAMNARGVRYLLIGGMNFMLRHKPLLTFEVDLWIEDLGFNLKSCEAALADLDAEWGATDDTWASVAGLPAGWLERQAVYCLNSPHGAIDIMRAVEGMSDWQSAWDAGIDERTNSGTPYRGLSDADMLRCQQALEAGQQKAERVRILKEVLGQ